MSKIFSKSIINKIKNINSNHYFILIGKDGQVKSSYDSRIEIEKILSDVDRMPMRKYEMKKIENSYEWMLFFIDFSNENLIFNI